LIPRGAFECRGIFYFVETGQDFNAARADVRHCMERYEVEPSHVSQVTRLATRLFEELRSLHHGGAYEEFLLHAASMLHDIGSNDSPDGRGHHRISQQMILAHPWTALDARTIRLVATIARYHRKEMPAADHPEFAILPEEDRRLVSQLAGILRVADGLDASHLSRVDDVEAVLEPERILLRLSSRWAAVDREILKARKKADLAEHIFARRLEFERVEPRNAPVVE
jgi:exopolyphosphatase/guanosine-5'-triphosphate,3'-diphosphate pyrophosphatase